MSGTLGFVLSAVSAGRPFSEAVREAMELGYTEPDPRDDLSGRDVARKGLILARLLGYAGRAAAAEDLRPQALRELPLAAFLKRLPDARRRVATRRAEQARAAGQVLRYVVAATPRRRPRRPRRRRRRLALGCALGHPQPDLVHDRRYRDEPLVITGPGAGARGHRGRHPERHPVPGRDALTRVRPSEQCRHRACTRSRE